MNDLRIQENVSLAPMSTFGIGGVARYFFEAKKSEELKEAVQWAVKNDISYKIFAGGSNVVFADEGFLGLVIRLIFKKMKVSDSERVIEAEAGVWLADLIKKAISKGWAGLETLSGIPGTVGGAVFGNAGAYGQSVSGIVKSVNFFDVEGGEAGILSNEECGFKYRHSIFKDKNFSILSVILQFQAGDKKDLKAKSEEIVKTREKKYKPGLRCPGSFFKNVLVKDVSKKSLALVDKAKIIDGKIPAGWLLEQVGAKGLREGGIYIADFHGNLFVNDGTGTARDVKALARILKKKVFDKFGIQLEEEVRYF
ncbi:MAG: UDP-N-acetylmuramate dehydrogenase [Nanoarchaeota archaeon]|nr:UDP-N-acetylmuramate dehydrogenase [Nanoarchaeota archaeon]